MATAAAKADEIQGQMRQVRYEMGDDVQGIVENARLLADWQYYVRSYPWVCLGVAAALGYLVVPPKLQVIKPDPKALVELAKAHQISVNADVKPKASGGLTGRLLNMLAGLALQGGVALASGQLNQFVERFGKSSQGNGQLGKGHEESHR
jgi:hypothetical protein